MSGRPTAMVARRLLPVCTALLREEPVIALRGPRTVGKSTMLRALAGQFGVEVIDLDDLATRELAAADPATIVQGPDPVCIDEYQHVRALLGAIKAELNRDLRPGRFLLTGSTTATAAGESSELTGRIHVLEMRPLSQGEVAGVHEDFVERFLDDPAALVGNATSRTLRDDYVARVVSGGLPLALQRTRQARDRWIDGYVRQTLERDVRELSRIQQRDALPRLLAAVIAQTGQLFNLEATAAAIDLDASTARSYTKLLEGVFLVERLPAWGTTLRARTVHTPKIHTVDSGVAARLLRLSAEKLSARNATALSQFGNLLESFAVGEIRKQASWLDIVSVLGHWRLHDGSNEVDIVLERPDGGIVAFEITAAQRVQRKDLGGLLKLRDAVGDSFVGGAALYLGARSYTFDNRIHVLPLDRLWTPST